MKHPTSKHYLGSTPRRIKQRSDPLVSKIPGGPLPVLPIGALNVADINLANLQLNNHNVLVAREMETNFHCNKYTAIVQYIKTAHFSRAFAFDEEAHAILIKNRVINLPVGLAFC